MSPFQGNPGSLQREEGGKGHSIPSALCIKKQDSGLQQLYIEDVIDRSGKDKHKCKGAWACVVNPNL